MLTNIESSLVSANEGLMRAYADLVPDPEVRDRFLGMIVDEYKRTRSILEELFKGTIEKRRPRLAYTLAIREDPLQVLHAQQIALLRLWRERLKSGQAEAAEEMLPDLLISVNALASGLRTTG